MFGTGYLERLRDSWVEPPSRLKVLGHLLLHHARSQELDGNASFQENAVVELFFLELAFLHGLSSKLPDLQRTYHVRELIERRISATERSADLSFRRVALVTNLIDQIVDALLDRHLFEMEVQREDDTRASVHSPEKHSDTILRGFLEAHVPKEEFIVKSVSFDPERGAERSALKVVPRRVHLLKMVTGDQFVVDRRPCKVDVVRSKTA
jgi:hypothetical protein